MNIYEATKKATSENKKITRKQPMWEKGNVRIEPTNSEMCCIIHADFRGEKSSRRRWHPAAEDLMADDWEVVK